MDSELTLFSTPPLTPDTPTEKKNADYHNVEEGKSIPPENAKRPESISITPELFERLYISARENDAENRTRGFGNPTPV